MNLDKKKSLWRKLRIKYEYSWMDIRPSIIQDPAPPTWFMMHNSKQIERRVAEHNAEMEQLRKEQLEFIHQLRLIYEQSRRDAAEERNSRRF